MPYPYEDYVIECSFADVEDPEYTQEELANSDFVAYLLTTQRPTRYVDIESITPQVGERYFGRCLGNCVLSAIETGLLESEEGSTLVHDIIRGEVTMESKAAFEKVAPNFAELAKRRRLTLISSATKGNFGVSELMAKPHDNETGMSEFEELFEFYVHGARDIKWVNKDGLVGKWTNKGIEPTTWPIKGNYEKEYTAELAKQLGVSDAATQLEVIQPRGGWEIVQVNGLTGGLTHTTLGNVEDGQFIPVVTVLSKDHPARQNKQPLAA